METDSMACAQSQAFLWKLCIVIFYNWVRILYMESDIGGLRK